MKKSYQVLKPSYPIEDILKNITSTLTSGWTGDGGLTETFETKWSIYTGYKNSIYVNSCTSALHLALLALKNQFPEKTKVIVPNITFISSAAVVLYSSLELVLCDVDESLCLDPINLEKIITKDTLAVIFVGLGGNTNHLENINKICKGNKTSIILDAAHMAGSKIRTNAYPHLGSFADFICYSFQAVKNLGIADSGMLCTNEDKYLDEISKYRWMGINKTTYQRTQSKDDKCYKWEYEIDRLGYKYNGNALIASCCLAMMPYLEKSNIYRRSLRQRYIKGLKSVPEITFISHLNEKVTSSHLAQILLKDGTSSNERNIIISKLNENKIYPGVHYRALSQFKYYKPFAKYVGKSENISNRLISLPCHLEIELEDIDIIVSSLIKVVKQV